MSPDAEVPTDAPPAPATPGFRVALTCLILLLGLMPMLSSGSAILSIKHLAFLGLGLAGAVAVWWDALRGKAAPTLGTPTDIAFAVWVLTAVPAVMTARNEGMSRYSLGLFLALALTWLLTVKVVRTPRHVRWVFLAALVPAVVTSLLGLVAYRGFLAAGAPEEDRAFLLSTVLFAHSYLAAQYVVLVFVGGVVLLLHRGVSGVRALLLGLALLPCAAFLFVVGSRGAYLAVLVSLGVAVLISLSTTGRRRAATARIVTRLAIGLAFLLVLAAAAAVTGLLSDEAGYAVERVLLMFNADAAGHNFSRLAVWRDTLGMVADHLLFGVGPGSFDSTLPSYHFSARTVPHAHNQFLHVLATQGLLGLVAFLFLVRHGIRAARRALATLRDDTERFALLIAAVAALASILVYFLFETTLVLPEAGSLVIVLLALITRAGCTDRTRVSSPLWAHAGMLALMITVGVVHPVWQRYADAGPPALLHHQLRNQARAAAANGNRKQARELLEESLAQLREADEAFPYRPDFARAEADVLFELGRVPEALEANHEALARQPGAFLHLNTAGKLHMRLHQYAEAIEPLRRAINAHRGRGSEETYAGLGRAYLWTGRAEEAWVVFGDLIHVHYYHDVHPAILLDAAETMLELDRTLSFVTLLLGWYEDRVAEEDRAASRLIELRAHLAHQQRRPKRLAER